MKLTPFNKTDYKLIAKAFKFTEAYKLKFIMALVCLIFGIILDLVQPLLWGNLLTRLFSKDYKVIYIFIICLSILYIVQAVFSFFRSYLFSYLNENIIFDLKKNIFEKIIDLPVSAFDNMGVGTFISRLHDDTAAIANIITDQLLNTIIDLLKVIVIGVVVFAISPPLAFVTLISFPLTYILFLKFGNILKAKNLENRVFYDKYFSAVQESITGIREIKSLGIKHNKIEMFSKLSFKIKLLNIKMNIIEGLSQNLSMVIDFLTQITIFSLGAYLIYKGSLKMEYFIAFTSYSQQFSSSLTNVTRMNSNIQRVLVSLERLFSLIDDLDYSHEIFGDLNIDETYGNIAFENVNFNYNDNLQLLRGISFEIKANKKYAIVGLNGAGKTTIFNLILRFYDPQSGNIKIDDIDIKTLNEVSLRKHISIVRQEPLLFNLSIKENLLLANSDASLREIENACKIADIHDYIISLPNGYEFIVLENGANFSSGQKQKIAIARAILKKSQIILFDEATSAVDNKSQYQINKAINKLSSNHTIIIIAHTLINIIDSDEILVMDNGKIAQQGNHNFLINNSEIYNRLYAGEVEIRNKKLIV